MNLINCWRSISAAHPENKKGSKMNFGAVDRYGEQQRKNKQIVAFYSLKTTILENVKCSRFFLLFPM
jgi:hypothetical protein